MADKPNEVDIKIKAEGNNAIVTISRVKDSIKSISQTALNVSRSIGRALSVFSRLNWIVSSIQLVVEGIKKLREWMDRASTAARELHDRLASESIATAAAHAVESYKKLNKELAEANRLEKERNAILDQRKGMARDLEDANLERSKQMEIAKLDPASATYAEDKAAIERKYARQSSTIAAARADEDSRERAKKLYAEADRMDSQAAMKERAFEKQNGVAQRWRDEVWRQGMNARRGVEGAQEKHDKAEQEWNKAEEAAAKIREEFEQMRREADSLRSRAAEMTGGSRAAHIRDEANQTRIDNEERDAAAKKQAAEKAEAEREAAEKRRAEEREAERIERERIVVENRERAEKISMFSRMEGAAVSADAVSQNRLTAMGLGSGVSAQGSGVANDVRKIVDLLKQEIEATKQIKPGEAKFEE